MPCFYPLKGYRSKTVGKSGKRGIVFDSKQGYSDMPVTLSCGNCIGCRLDRSKSWATRIIHEAELHEENCFITLTYSPENLPANETLVKEDFQNFMKKLRREIYPERVRFFHCGEYGNKLNRPHYHACIFGLDFRLINARRLPDSLVSDEKVLTAWNRTGTKKYTLVSNEYLEKMWGKGFVTVGDLEYDSAAYVARYITKKINGKDANEHYVNKVTGELKEPEYITMSRRPGIGKKWFDKYKESVYNRDSVIIKGKEQRPPKYYDKLYEEIDGGKISRIKKRRIKNVSPEDQTPERLRDREICTMAKFNLKKRGLEDETTSIRDI